MQGDQILFFWLGASAEADQAPVDQAASRLAPTGVDPSRKCEHCRLWDAIKHGDAEHRAWLYEAVHNFFGGKPVPPPRGGGLKK